MRESKLFLETQKGSNLLAKRFSSRRRGTLRECSCLPWRSRDTDISEKSYNIYIYRLALKKKRVISRVHRDLVNLVNRKQNNQRKRERENNQSNWGYSKQIVVNFLHTRVCRQHDDIRAYSVSLLFPFPFSPRLKGGYGHARAKNILAKCDSRVSLSSSTDVVEAIKSEPEAASRGLKRLLYPYCLSTPIHFFIRRKKKLLFAEKVCLKNRGSGYTLPRSFFSIPPSFHLPPHSLYDFLGEAYPEKEINESI